MYLLLFNRDLDTLKDYLSELAAESETIKTSTLLELSGVSGRELDKFSDIWLTLECGIKVKILTGLTELAELDVQLDFTPICRLGLLDLDPTIRKAALEGLWEIQDRSFLQPIIDILMNDPDPDVRSAAALSLSSFAQMSQNGKLINRDSTKLFEALIQTIENVEEDDKVLGKALESIGYFSDQAVDDALNKFHRHKNPLLRQSAIFAMGRNAQQKWIDIILNDLIDENPAIRFEALNAAGFLCDESNVTQIIPFTKNSDIQIQTSALTTLGYIGGELAKHEILTWTEDDDDNIRDAAINALANIDFEQDPLGLSIRE